MYSHRLNLSGVMSGDLSPSFPDYFSFPPKWGGWGGGGGEGRWMEVGQLISIVTLQIIFETGTQQMHWRSFRLFFQEVLQIYLTQHPDSATAVNLRACNQYKLYHGKAAEKELRTLQDQTTSSFLFAKDLITHNTVIFMQFICILIKLVDG